jgi:transposase
MGSKSRREYPLEFKREAVLLWETSGRPQMDVARELGIQPSFLRRWQKAGCGSQPAAAPAARPVSALTVMTSPADQAAEIARLKRELDRARMERDILKKAVGICAEVPR